MIVEPPAATITVLPSPLSNAAAARFVVTFSAMLTIFTAATAENDTIAETIIAIGNFLFMAQFHSLLILCVYFTITPYMPPSILKDSPLRSQTMQGSSVGMV